MPEQIAAVNNGNAWAAMALPLAAVLGEDLRLDLPVDPWLPLNAETLLTLWRHRHPKLVKPFRVEAETLPASAPKPAVVSSFTAGIDSFFTVLRHPECKHYIHVLGLDMPLWKQDAHDRLTARLEAIAESLGAKLFRMATNLRQTRWGKLPWENFASGAALSGSMLLLEGNFGTALIPASHSVAYDTGWGSHPLSDPLYSTSTMRILHDGASHTRVEKTEILVHHPLVLDHLHVCFLGQDTHGQDDTNCSRCSKCYRTMLVLDALRKLKECKTFDATHYTVDLAASIECTTTAGKTFMLDVRALAERRGRSDIVRALDKSFRRSRIAKMLDPLAHTPLLWRLPYYWRQHAFGRLAHLDWRPINP
jgi:hypothetical protein